MGFKSRAKTAEVKTVENKGSVPGYLRSISNVARRADAEVVMRIMSEVSGEPPKLWGSTIVGFGRYHYKYATGREGDWLRMGLSARKKSLTLYCMAGYDNKKALLKQLGKVEHSVSCLYINSLDDVDMAVLRKLIKLFWKEMAARYPN